MSQRMSRRLPCGRCALGERSSPAGIISERERDVSDGVPRCGDGFGVEVSRACAYARARVRAILFPQLPRDFEGPSEDQTARAESRLPTRVFKPSLDRARMEP